MNPSGVAKAFSSAPTASPTKPSGSDDVAVYGGFIFSGEKRRELVGRNKWLTYDNLCLQVAIIASAVNVWTQLAGSAKWSCEPNERCGKDGQRGADICTQGLLESQMSTPWRQVVRKQSLKKARGLALHEALIRRRSDGMVVIGDLLHRPQSSLFRWDKPDEQAPWKGVEQLTRMGHTFYIPRERLLYSVEDTLSGNPEGIGLLRQVCEAARRLDLFEQWEAIGFQTDLRGTPLARAPLGLLVEQAKASGCKTQDAIQAYITTQTKFLTDFFEGHTKAADTGVLLDSAPYRAKDAAQAVSGVEQWSFELVKGAAASMPDVGTAIGRLTREIARVFCCEWLLLGGEDSGGAYSMHEDKTAMFGLLVNSTLGDIADDAQRDLCARLVALNGLDPETCTPRLVVEPVATGAVENACRSLMLLAQAGLHPQDKARDVLRARLDLPKAPDVDANEWMLPRGTELAPEGGGIVGMPKPKAPMPVGDAGAPKAPGGADATGKPEVPPPPDSGKPGNVNAQSTNAPKGKP